MLTKFPGRLFHFEPDGACGVSKASRFSCITSSKGHPKYAGYCILTSVCSKGFIFGRLYFRSQTQAKRHQVASEKLSVSDETASASPKRDKRALSLTGVCKAYPAYCSCFKKLAAHSSGQLDKFLF